MTAATVTWEFLADVESRLLAMERAIQAVRGDVGPSFCANRVWCEQYKPILEQLVGWFADSKHPALRSSGAWDIAHDYLYNQLPDCRNCWCL